MFLLGIIVDSFGHVESELNYRPQCAGDELLDNSCGIAPESEFVPAQITSIVNKFHFIAVVKSANQNLRPPLYASHFDICLFSYR